MAERTVSADALQAPGRAEARSRARLRLPGLGWAIGLIVPALLLLLWQSAAQHQWLDADILPSPGTVAGTFW